MNKILGVTLCCLCLWGMTGCGPRMSATVWAESLTPSIPRDKTWELVVGPQRQGAFVSQTQDVLASGSHVSAFQPFAMAINGPLENALTLYGWKHVAENTVPDVLMRVWWSVSPPMRVLEVNTYYFGPPVLGYEDLFNAGTPLWEANHWDVGRWDASSTGTFGTPPLRTEVYRGRRYPQVQVQIVFQRRLFVEAVDVAGLTEEEVQALRVWKVAPNANGQFPQGMTFTGQDYAFWGQTGYAKAPEKRVLWQVVVKSVGSTPGMDSLLPLFSAAAARYMGINTQVDVRVNADLEVYNYQ